MENAPAPFLRHVAEDLYKKYGNDLSKVTVVFPNYRSRLFFSRHLAEIAEKTIWSPRYTTIKDLFVDRSQAQIPDQMKLICILYKVYSEFVEKKESFDEFYFWGEILLSDFDDVDKNLVDAEMLFSNIRDMGDQIDTFEHLSEEQRNCLKSFFVNFSPERSSLLKEQFIQLWDSLLLVYENFKKRLDKGGESSNGQTKATYAYEGMLYRDVIEKLKRDGVDGFESEKYAFVGFNVLNECEKTLFKLLESAGKAIFYWDYDTYYTDNRKNEASRFINEDKTMFPNQLSGTVFENLSTQKKRITFVSASTENAQARYLSSHLQRAKAAGAEDSEIGVVLCNEGLLLPVLHSIPACIEETNITMGFPLSQTPVYSLVLNMLDMQMDIRQNGGTYKYRYATVAPLLRHPYVRTTIRSSEKLFKNLSEQRVFHPDIEEICKTNREALRNESDEEADNAEKGLRTLLRWAGDPTSLLTWILDTLRFVASYHRGKGEGKNEDSPLYEDLYEESIFRLYTQISRLKEVVLEEGIEMAIPTLVRLVKQLLGSITVPFKGEPIKGMQIMGFLESRNLDFKNVVLLSVNEGKLPNSGKDSSFVPHNLRKGYGMTTIDHKNSLYAYYFYRLLQRAESITMLYNTATEGTNRGQMSRFMLQLLVEKGNNIEIEMQDIHATIPVAEPHSITIKKTETEINILREKYDHRKNENARFLSPTAINCYIDCSLQFYFRYILGLRVDEDLSEEVDAPKFGSIFHKAAELFYAKHMGTVLSKEFLEKESKRREYLESLVDEAFKTEYFNLEKNSPKAIEYTGEQLIYRKVETDLLQKLLRADAEYAPFSIYQLEQKHFEEIPVSNDEIGEEILLKVGGIIDRIDLKEGVMRTVDYKTSNKEVKAATIESIFNQSDKRESYLVQVLLYAMVLANEHPEYTIRPSLLFVTKKLDYTGTIKIKDEEKDAKKSVEIEDIREYSEEYKTLLTLKLKEMFDMKVGFTQTPFEKHCGYCEFRNICRKRKC